MDAGTDIEVIRAAAAWLEQGTAVTLVTVARTWGSAPRRPGALMAINADGRFAGSVSGGCVEDDLVQRVLRGEFTQQQPRLVEYGINTAATRRVGLPCGGRLELVVEYLDSAQPVHRLLESMTAGQPVERRVCLHTGEASLHPVSTEDGFRFDQANLVKVFGPRWRLLIIGAGELSRRVAQLALTLDFAVTLNDSRPEYASGWEVEGTDFSTAPSADYLDRFAPDPRSVILALAHAPALEDEALARALTTDAFYVGALGLRKNQKARVGRLRRKGLTEEQLARLHGPVGLDIGSHTPAEIAIAIVAALVQARNRQTRSVDQAAVTHG